MSKNRFPDVPGGYPFPELELETLQSWRDKKIFEKSLEQTADGEPFVFFEGPPTANNVPHVGHVVTRVVKDLLPRFRTMQGRSVQRKAGWDTHGLPVEIEVEKRLGFTGKQDIERYGVEKFNRACLESVDTYEKQWREMTERVGFWVDLDEAYFTYTNKYIESGWWALSSLFDRDLLVKDYKIQPYCARCGTTLSSHEVAQNYKEADDPSVWVLFPVRTGQSVTTVDGESWEAPEGLHIVAWTTTPWTLLGHSGLAIGADLTYRVISHPDVPGQLIAFAEGLDNPVPLEREIDGKRQVVDLRSEEAIVRLKGSELAGLRYDRPFGVEFDRASERSTYSPLPSDEDGFFVFEADYVTLSEGTGVVHTAPAFGEDDYRSGQKHGLPFLLTVTQEGKIDDRPGTEPYAGQWFKDADKAIRSNVKERGLLLHGAIYRHNYPFCWRCDQPLLYYASPSWFIRTTVHKDDLVDKNKQIAWHPAHVGEGRFGNWLENVVDWALSRKRYWGTPLPIWECDGCERREAVGSYEELFTKAGRELPADPYDREQFDPHRPFVDRDAESPFVWSCGECDGTMGRVTEVIDAWFDSGAMPFAQHHYPFENKEAFESGKLFPANFISEAVDQTRGWFYTLHVLGTLLFDSYAYENCIVLGHINDEQGRKMSKRLGNVTNPMEVMPETGADALRWYFYISNPELSGRFSARLVREAAQQFMLPLWNALSFFTIYANLDSWHPDREAPDVADRPSLDRWILLRLDRLVRETTEHLEGYRISDSARGIETFIDELTNWYIRRSRDRFWAGEEGDANLKNAAYATLYEVLTTITRMIAPFTPFVAEVMHEHLVRSQETSASESVHLETWPKAQTGRDDDELERAMAAVQRIVRLGHAARNEHGLKTRQPLSSVTIVSTDASLPGLVEPHNELLRDELNVHEVLWAKDRSVYVHHDVLPIFPICGPRFGKRMPLVKKALMAADGDTLAAALEADGKITVDLEGEPTEFSRDEVEVRLIEREGSATQGDRELLVALETELTDALIHEGWAREVVNRIQTARRTADLDYADRIRLRYEADETLAAAIAQHADWIQSETLTVETEIVSDGSGHDLETAQIDDLHFAFAIEKV